MSFYFIFNPTKREINDDNNQENKLLFPDFGNATLKVIAMMAGEFTFDELPFQINPVMSRLIFVCFLLFINIVLINLLIGWAVSDIQAIKCKVFLKQNAAPLVPIENNLILIFLNNSFTG